jgi:hypothetical protein
MILVRDVFRLKFGKARDALAAFKGIGESARTKGNFGAQSMRILSDLVGPYYTLVFEATHADLASYERDSLKGMSDPEWKKAYATFIPLVESGYREIFTIHELV